MNRNLSLALVASAAACGIAWAQLTPVQGGTPLDALQKRVETLEAEVAELKKRQPSAELGAALAADHTRLEQVVAYLQGQSTAADRLLAVLADSKDKGFTYGINPDSRVVLLQGFNDFCEKLKSEVPGSAAPKPDATKSNAKR